MPSAARVSHDLWQRFGRSLKAFGAPWRQLADTRVRWVTTLATSGSCNAPRRRPLAAGTHRPHHHLAHESRGTRNRPRAANPGARTRRRRGPPPGNLDGAPGKVTTLSTRADGVTLMSARSSRAQSRAALDERAWLITRRS